MTLTAPSYRTIADVTAEVCGDYIDFGGEFFTITPGSQPGFVTITYSDGPAAEALYQDVCAAIDIELISRRTTQL